MVRFDFEEEKVAEFIKGRRGEKVAVQLPAGLKRFQDEILDVYWHAGVEPVVFDSCFGACDLADRQAKLAGCSALVHYGHADMGLRTEIPVLYVEARIRGIDTTRLRKPLERICAGESIGIFTAVQYLDLLRDVASMARQLGGSPVIGRHGWRTKYDGQVLGCDLKSACSADCERLLYLGTGKFHPLGASICSGRSVFCLDPHTGGVEEIQAEEFLRRRTAYVLKGSNAEKWCVVVSTKPGQFRLALAERILHRLRSCGRRATLVMADRISPDLLADFDPDAAVIVACPRIPIDDWELFDFPVLTPPELSIALGESSSYRFDEVKESDFKM